MKLIAMTVFCVDYYNGADKICLGGNSLNFAVQSLKSRIEQVSVLGCVGNDRYGVMLKKYIADQGLPLAHIYTAQGKTASNKIYIDESGDRYFEPDSWDGGVYQKFRLSKSDWDFVRSHDVIAMPAGDPNLIMALEQKASDNALVVDFLDSRDYGFITEVLKDTSIGFLSGNVRSVEKLVPFSEHHDAAIVVTMGAKGSIAIYKGKRFYTPAEKVDEVIDTTGCGDAYQAAFTASWFCRHDIEAAMKEGSVASAQVLAHFGGV
jgi:fructoselysine 6-kinase